MIPRLLLVAAICTRFLCLALYFHYSRNMENKTAVTLLAALAQETRLAIFRHLVVLGPQGLNACKIGEALAIPPATLSFHLKELTHAGLIEPRQEGRFIFYSARFEAMGELLAFLAQDCCGGRECGLPAAQSACGEGCN